MLPIALPPDSVDDKPAADDDEFFIERPFPINELRNLAIVSRPKPDHEIRWDFVVVLRKSRVVAQAMVRTSHLVVLDADFVPSRGARAAIQSHLRTFRNIDRARDDDDDDDDDGDDGDDDDGNRIRRHHGRGAKNASETFGAHIDLLPPDFAVRALFVVVVVLVKFNIVLKCRSCRKRIISVFRLFRRTLDQL
jgi:hypothetical protein